MRIRHSGIVAAALSAALVTACGSGDPPQTADSPSSATSSPPRGIATATPTPSSSPWQDDDDILLNEGDCYGPPSFAEVSCDDPKAVGRVLKRGESLRMSCPDDADQLIPVRKEGFACTRNLKPPHPGDPGGGGMALRVGDCLQLVSRDKYKEIACAGEDHDQPEYEITKKVTDPSDCPKETAKVLATDDLLTSTGINTSRFCARVAD